MGHRELTVRRVVNEASREHFAHTLEGDIDRTAQWNDVFESIGRIKHPGRFHPGEFCCRRTRGDTSWRTSDGRPADRGVHEEGRTHDRRHSADDPRAFLGPGNRPFEALPVFQKYRGSEPLILRPRSALDARRPARSWRRDSRATSQRISCRAGALQSESVRTLKQN